VTITSYNPRTGLATGTVEEMSPHEVEAAVKRASDASSAVAAASPWQRRVWLHAVAAALVAETAELVELAEVETALGYTRLTSEISRAAGQLRFYGDVAAEGSYLAATIDSPTSTTPGLARVNQPLGPVAVFGASNFPFAFGVLGNDFGSACAAGCPVVVKSHPAHPLLSDRLAGLARTALLDAGAPDGSLEMVVGYDAGVALVRDEGIAALAFTGSQAAGLALWRIANQRRTVIPTYAEMSTVNPVVVTRAAAATRMEEIAEGFVGSFTLGSGQFCTKPGLVFAPAGAAAVEAIGKALRQAAPEPVMLTAAIARSTAEGLEELRFAGARLVELVEPSFEGWCAPAAVLEAPIEALQDGSRLLEECFGAVAVVVEYSNLAELVAAVERLQGSLAASVFTADENDPDAAACLALLSPKVGRLCANDWPTGVAYTWAQQHGGPWPSTSASWATSVGAAALDRFVRPVTYQSLRDEWLPPALQAANPWNLSRRVNGVLQPRGASQ
jgi:NADP-dependent aldehyde dehydrogenase